jgi:hypothetical protein
MLNLIFIIIIFVFILRQLIFVFYYFCIIFNFFVLNFNLLLIELRELNILQFATFLSLENVFTNLLNLLITFRS